MTARCVRIVTISPKTKAQSSKVIGAYTVLKFIYNVVVHFTATCLALCSVYSFACVKLHHLCIDTNVLFSLKAVLKSPMPSRLIAPAPASNQGHISIPPKVPGHITVTIESSTTTPSIPVATISGQQVRTSASIHFALYFFQRMTKCLECCLWSLGPLQQPAPSDAC